MTEDREQMTRGQGTDDRVLNSELGMRNAERKKEDGGQRALELGIEIWDCGF
jgi:hypothetical protein